MYFHKVKIKDFFLRNQVEFVFPKKMAFAWFLSCLFYIEYFQQHCMKAGHLLFLWPD